MNDKNEEKAVVIELKSKNSALVELKPSSACGSCTLCETKPIRVTALNNKNAKVGDIVTINTNKFKTPLIVFNVYVMPLILLIVGYFTGSLSYNLFNIKMDKESFSATFAFLFFLGYIIIAIAITKRHKKFIAIITNVEQNN